MSGAQSGQCGFARDHATMVAGQKTFVGLNYEHINFILNSKSK